MVACYHTTNEQGELRLVVSLRAGPPFKWSGTRRSAELPTFGSRSIIAGSGKFQPPCNLWLVECSSIALSPTRYKNESWSAASSLRSSFLLSRLTISITCHRCHHARRNNRTKPLHCPEGFREIPRHRRQHSAAWPPCPNAITAISW